MNYPDGMTRSDLIAVGEIEADFQGVTKVIRAVVYITYKQEEIDDPEDDIENCQSADDAEKDIKRTLEGGSARYQARAGLQERPDKIEVVDAQYMTPEEADNYAG